MYSMIVMTALAAGSEAPAWHRLHYPYKCCTGYRKVDPCYDGGWWYGATAWDGCPPQYISPPWHGAPPCGCGCGHGDGPIMETYPANAPMPAADPEKEPASRDRSGLEGAGRAHLIVDLPQGARLYVDGMPVAAAPGRQVLPTPVLKAGQVYYYEVGVEVVRDGRAHRESRKLVVRPGDELQVTFFNRGPDLGAPATAAASK